MSDKPKIGKQKHLGLIEDALRHHDRGLKLLTRVFDEIEEHGKLTDRGMKALYRLSLEYPQIKHRLDEMNILVIEAKEQPANVVRAEDKFGRRAGNE